MPKGRPIQPRADVKNRQFDSGKRPPMQPIMINRPVTMNVAKPERRNVIPPSGNDPYYGRLREHRPSPVYTTNIPGTPMIARQGQVSNVRNAIVNLFRSVTQPITERNTSRRNNR